MIHRSIITITFGTMIACAWSPQAVRGEETPASVLVDFESVKIGEHVESWQEGGVTFTLAHQPTKSKAKGRVMFFPHIASGHKGILNAMADEAIPVRAELPTLANVVELKIWGSTTSAAVVEAFDNSGKLIDRAAIDRVPVRKRPEDPVPFFELTVRGRDIASIQISGSQPGGFIAVDELRFYPQDTADVGAADVPARSDQSAPLP